MSLHKVLRGKQIPVTKIPPRTNIQPGGKMMDRPMEYVDEMKPCQKNNLLQRHEVEIHELKAMIKLLRQELKGKE